MKIVAQLLYINDSYPGGEGPDSDDSDEKSVLSTSDISDIPLDLMDRLDDQWIEEFKRIEITDLFRSPCEPESRLSFLNK